MKKLISSILLIFVIASMAVWADNTSAANGEEDIMLISEEAAGEVAEEMFEETAPSHLIAYGEITELGEGFAVVSTMDGQTIRFNYDENSYIIDANTVLPLDLANRTTDKVAVYHSSAMTRSLPPQSYAYAIVGNIENDLGNPIYTNVESVTKTDDGIEIMTNNDSLIITVPNTASVAPYLTRNIVTLDDVKAGSKILLWYDAVAQSLPAQAYSERVVILKGAEPQVEDLPEVLLPENVVLINDISITLNDDEMPYYENDVKMLPIRTVAEGLGYEVIWNEADTSITVQKDDFSTVVYISEINDEYYTKAIQRRIISPRAVLNGSKTYVEESFFAGL